MPLNLASPGILVREVDLTLGRVDPTTDKIGGIVGPFAQGPVGTPTLINTENDLLNTFGQPYDVDKQYETWLTASSYLAYGGIMNVVRADDAGLYNGTVGAAASVKIKSNDHYEELGYDINVYPSATIVAKNPGSWSNGIKIGIIDGYADQNLTINSLTNVEVGYGVTQAVIPNTVVSKTGTVGAGKTENLDGYFKGIITKKGATHVDVKVLSHVSAAGTETATDYNSTYKFGTTGNLTIVNNAGVNTATPSVTAAKDWFDSQTIELTNGAIPWNQVADRPGTSKFADARSSRFDEVHVVVVDDKGTVTGNAGTILEKSVSLSKAKDAEFSAGSTSYWRKFIANSGSTIFAGGAPSGISTTNIATGAGGTSYFNAHSSDNAWDQNAQGISFAGIGATTLTLAGGQNYDSGTDATAEGALTVPLEGLVTGYELYENTEEFDIDFILMGGGGRSTGEVQALASEIISVAEIRQDAIAFVSPSRSSLITDTVGSATVNTSSTITENLKTFYSPIQSSSYAVFDSGYKYMYDRFADTFRYVPLNGDIAGTCARNDINNFPWFSPAGTARGSILNAVKLAYNPSQTQRDKLYTNRINPIVFSPGAGIILFGDKTGYGKASAFDRINVRRLFIYLEDAISAAARDQLFEFNDEITRTNFVNIVEPFLRDVQAKRGITDFRLVCDETNNTAAVIDNNEFIADVFIKPNRSINFIGLTFVATRTGVSFDEVIGTV